MSKSEELEIRRYFIRALGTVSSISLSIVIAIGGWLYKQADGRIENLEKYRIEHTIEAVEDLKEYSDRITRIEEEVKAFKAIQEERQKTLDQIIAGQRLILQILEEMKRKN